MMLSLPRPWIFAHRGASSQAPENTLPAFELAVEHSADAVELDVQLSTDGVVVVIHDSTVNRTTNGSGQVKDLSLDTIKSLDAGGKLGPSHQGTKIPTLAEVLSTFGQQIYFNIELKPGLSLRYDLPQKVAQIVVEQGMTGRTLFSSFDPFAVIKIKTLLPDTPCAFLSTPGRPGWLVRKWGRRIIKCDALHPHFADVDLNLVRETRSDNQLINVYTVNDVDMMTRLFSLGVDGIITDKPDLAIQVRERYLATAKNYDTHRMDP